LAQSGSPVSANENLSRANDAFSLAETGSGTWELISLNPEVRGNTGPRTSGSNHYSPRKQNSVILPNFLTVENARPQVPTFLYDR
jgi:hypothetical protein